MNDNDFLTCNDLINYMKSKFEDYVFENNENNSIFLVCEMLRFFYEYKRKPLPKELSPVNDYPLHARFYEKYGSIDACFRDLLRLSRVIGKDLKYSDNITWKQYKRKDDYDFEKVKEKINRIIVDNKIFEIDEYQKLDIKISNLNNNNRWRFTLNSEKNEPLYICFGFDNKKDILLKIWLIVYNEIKINSLSIFNTEQSLLSHDKFALSDDFCSDFNELLHKK